MFSLSSSFFVAAPFFTFVMKLAMPTVQQTKNEGSPTALLKSKGRHIHTLLLLLNYLNTLNTVSELILCAYSVIFEGI